MQTFKFSFLFPSTAPKPINEEMPVFEDTIPNITVALGRDLTLPCTVNKLGNYRVSTKVALNLFPSGFLRDYFHMDAIN